MNGRNNTKNKFEQGRGYDLADWQEVSDNPIWKNEDIAKSSSFLEAFPELVENMKKNTGGRPRKENPKQAVSIRLDADVVKKFKATGYGWQTRINAILKSVEL